MKKIIIVKLFSCLILILSILSNTVSAASVLVNGNDFEESLIDNNTAYVAVRNFGCIVGEFEIGWNSASATAVMSGSGLNIEFSEGRNYIIANGRYLYSDAPVKIFNNTLYAPIRSLAKALNGSVVWNNSTGKAEFTSGIGVIASAEMFYNPDDLYWLSRIISAESRGESLLGQIAVGNVVINRMQSKEFPDSIYSVIFDRKFGVQFSPVSSGTIYAAPAESSIIAAKIVLDGYSVSDSIMYFLDKSIATSFWIVDNRPHVFKLGCHDFYA